MVTGLAPKENMDPSRWTHFLASINNTAITDKVLRGKTLPRNLDEAMSRAIQLEAGFQLSEGVNMARRVNIMQAKVNKTEVVGILEQDPIFVGVVERLGISIRIVEIPIKGNIGTK